MTSTTFQLNPRKAERTQVRLRMMLSGVSNSGKTLTAIKLASELASDPSKIIVFDTEPGASELYAKTSAGGYEFMVQPLEDCSLDTVRQAFEAAVAAGFKVIILDSGSDVWEGQGGALAESQRIQATSGNNYAGWNTVSQKWHALWRDAMGRLDAHVIVTWRVQAKTVLFDHEGRPIKGKKVAEKLIAKPDADPTYWFSIAGEIDQDHTLEITKWRSEESEYQGMIFEKPGSEFAELVKGWLTTGKVADPLRYLTTKALKQQVISLAEAQGVAADADEIAEHFRIEKEQLQDRETLEAIVRGDIVSPDWLERLSADQAEREAYAERVEAALEAVE